MSAPPPRTTVAVVGTGAMAAAMADDLARCEGTELTAVVSRDARRAREFADRHGVRVAVATPSLGSLDVDLVYVATPHQDHAPTARAALESGHHVLVEKAFTLDAAEAEELTALAAARDRFLMEAMWMRFNPAVRRLQGLLAEGAVGEPRAVSAGFGRPVPQEPAHRLWAPEGGGTVLDQGVYPVTLADLVLGAPDTVAATGSRRGYDGRDAGVETEAAVVLGFPGGRQALCWTSIRAALPRRATVSGAGGHLELDEPFWCTGGLTLHRTGTEPERFDLPLEGRGYVPMLRAVHAAVSQGLREHPLCPPAWSVRVMRVLDEVRRQLRDGATTSGGAGWAGRPEDRAGAAARGDSAVRVGQTRGG
ncbi:Gfo/Idh/MocA family oxidoreductase [Kineococcus sp. R8]|uniref:Gfo/Idh/MocA family protein n=1 Tax=Kineococcus siccus TaxID=2696567 RepID=UPI00141234E8|nr:Gfo/Idh/MocA family oxidoreductase [Kineococcus siccus]NAZ81950.1 Gfo/Idh/MocA family oxidoreductase [Kineococcus siccus]